MKHIKKAQDRATDSKAYRYTVGVMLVVGDVLKSGLLGVINHITELLMALSFVIMIVVCNAFDGGAINYTVTILFVTMLAIIVVALIKIKLLEGKK